MANITLGQTINESLSSTDTKNPKRSGSFSDDYTLSGFSNWQQVQVNLDSTGIDSYLQLVNASTGAVIADNDDLIQGNKNSQLKFTVVPGVNYAIRATSLNANETGNYTIKTSSLGTASSLVSTSSGEVGTVDSAGRFVKIASSPILNDIALSSDNRLFGFTDSQLYKIEPGSGLSTLIGTAVGANAEIVGLEFSPTNVLYATGGSNLYTINSTTGEVSLVANLGSDFDASGDLVFDPISKGFFATSGVNSNNSLFSVSLTGQATKIGNIGFTRVLGLSSKDGNLFGFTGAKQRIVINPATGVGTLDTDVTGVSGEIFGATSIVTPTPPTPTPPTPTPPTPTPPTPTPPTPTPPTPPTPTPPTPPTPTPPIPLPAPIVPANQIPKPDSSGEVDLDPLKLKVVNGQFVFNDKTNRYEASGTIQIGRKDGTFPLITVQEGKVEYDSNTVSVDGIISSLIGANSIKTNRIRSINRGNSKKEGSQIRTAW